MTRRFAIILAASFVLVALVLTLLSVTVCREWGFVDRNTGSRKGYREWLFGWRSGVWYRESALEAFMQSNHADELQQDWVSYQGTGLTLLGRPTLFEHGRPGPILFVSLDVLDWYCRSASDADKHQLYKVLASRDAQKISERIDEIAESVLNTGRHKAGPDKAASDSRPARSETNAASSSPDGGL